MFGLTRPVNQPRGGSPVNFLDRLHGEGDVLALDVLADLAIIDLSVRVAGELVPPFDEDGTDLGPVRTGERAIRGPVGVAARCDRRAHKSRRAAGHPARRKDFYGDA